MSGFHRENTSFIKPTLRDVLIILFNEPRLMHSQVGSVTIQRSPAPSSPVSVTVAPPGLLAKLTNKVLDRHLKYSNQNHYS